MNQFDIHALYFGCYAMFIPLNKWSYMVIGYLTSVSSSMYQLALTLFPLCNELLLYFFNHPIRIIIILYCYYVCFYYRLSVWNNILSLTPFKWAFTYGLFISFKECFELQKTVTLSSKLIFYYIVYPLSRVTLDVEYIMLFSQYCTLVVHVDRPY